jgi:hypothetical protein
VCNLRLISALTESATAAPVGPVNTGHTRSGRECQMQRLKFLRHTTPRACSRLSARESIYMCSVVSARCLIFARAYPAIAITANNFVPARPKIPVGVSQNHCAMVKTVFSAFRRFDSMLVKGMLRLCHLLVIRLSCSAHLCVQFHFTKMFRFRCFLKKVRLLRTVFPD